MSWHYPGATDGATTPDLPEGWQVEHCSVGHLVVAVAGEVDALTAAQLTAAIREARAESPPTGADRGSLPGRFPGVGGMTVLLTARNQVPPGDVFGVRRRRSRAPKHDCARSPAQA